MAAAGELRSWRRRGQELSGSVYVAEAELAPGGSGAEQAVCRARRLQALTGGSCSFLPTTKSPLLVPGGSSKPSAARPAGGQVARLAFRAYGRIQKDNHRVRSYCRGCVDMRCPGQQGNRQTTALRSNRGCSLRISEILEILQAQARTMLHAAMWTMLYVPSSEILLATCLENMCCWQPPFRCHGAHCRGS